MDVDAYMKAYLEAHVAEYEARITALEARVEALEAFTPIASSGELEAHTGAHRG